jgi:2-keto-4-pentenoate hydratase/2-oxohepta-3-ene-1,7-dioic acid hydratase in catechol pathway
MYTAYPPPLLTTATVLRLGKGRQDVTVEDALSYVAAYTAGNDISSRKLQHDLALAGGVPQWGFSKGFDTFALVSSKLIGNLGELQLQTRVDGELRQDAGTNNLVFDVPYVISYLSSGTTLQKGSVIMTGTPGGTSPGTPVAIVRLDCLLTAYGRCRRWLQPSAVSRAGHETRGLRFRYRDVEEHGRVCAVKVQPEEAASCHLD